MRRGGGRAPAPERLAVGWAGMRGSVSLAAALAIPITIDAGGPFPDRDLIIFLTFAVILATLIGQGLTLGPLITTLGLQDDGMEEYEERVARQRVAEAGLGRIDELGEPEWIGSDSVERARNLLDYRRRRFGALADGDGDGFEGRADAWRRLMYDVLRRPAKRARGSAQPRRDQRRGAPQDRARPRPGGVPARELGPGL
jgi:CPA1 family monovalent cation:H+ antiporter